MKILDWLKNIFSRTRKNYMLNEGNDNIIQNEDKNFKQKLVVDNAEYKKSREDILRSLKSDMIVEDLSDEYNYTKFSPENVKEKYDNNSILSKEDITALSCLHGAITTGNMSYCKWEFVNGERKLIGNKINDFLKESPDNIVVLIDLMEKSAQKYYESLKDKELCISTTVQGLIPGSYLEISQLIEEYTKESEIEGR